MIITCPNCNKQFKIDNSLIPDEGRNLQCGLCNHVWFYKIEEKKSEILKLKEETVTNVIETKSENKEDEIEKTEKLEKIKTEINEEKKEKIKEIQETVPKSKILKNSGRNFFSYLVVSIISFVALIVLLDTLKTPLIYVFPGLELALFNLFETLKDIKLFIIDLY